MNKASKNIFIILIVLTIITSISSYSNSSESIDDLGYVMAIGFDVGENAKYKISLLLSTIESSTSDIITKSSSKSNETSSKSESSSSEFEVFTIECESLDAAVNISNSFINKDITLSHCKILIISETLAKQGVKNIINTLINKVEIRPDCNIIISKIPPEEFKNETPPNMEEILTKYYNVTSNIETNTAYNQSVQLTKFYLNLNDSLSQPYAALGNICNPQKKSSNKDRKDIDNQSRSLTSLNSSSSVETMGLAVFKDDVLVGTLSGIENICHLLITNKFDNCIISIPHPINTGETIDLYLFTVKNTQTDAKIINGSPFITSTLNVAVKVLAANDNSEILTQEKMLIIEQYTTHYLEEQLYNYFDKTSKQFEADISEIGRYAIKNFKTLEEWNNYNWLENYKNSTFKVNINMSMRTGILLTTE